MMPICCVDFGTALHATDGQLYRSCRWYWWNREAAQGGTLVVYPTALQGFAMAFIIYGEKKSAE
jgi:hypothetical protein